MAEQLNITAVVRREAYKELLPQLNALIDAEPSWIANLANISAALKQTFGFFWVGFYLVEKGELVLGPFQGEIACTRIGFGKGVCGSAWQNGETLVVPNVDEFPGHIACSSNSRSEIVVPMFSDGKVIGVLDVDSDKLDDFNEDDLVGLEKIAALAATCII